EHCNKNTQIVKYQTVYLCSGVPEVCPGDRRPGDPMKSKLAFLALVAVCLWVRAASADSIVTGNFNFTCRGGAFRTSTASASMYRRRLTASLMTRPPSGFRTFSAATGPLRQVPRCLVFVVCASLEIRLGSAVDFELPNSLGRFLHLSAW